MNPKVYTLTRILFFLFFIDALTLNAQCTSEGNILREFWTNVPGDNISDIPTDDPDGSSHPTIFEGNTNSGDNYAERFRGYICVPQTGQYTFWIESNNDGELWLSTNDNPENKVRIAFVDGWTDPGQWDKYASQKSALINLTAGKKYYIEALHKEGTQGDQISVGWQLPNGSLERPIPGNRLSPFLVIVPTELIQVNAQWKYLDNGSNQGTAWRAIGFNEGGWKTGNAELGYGDGDEATKVSYGPSKSNKYITTYFRKSFNISNAYFFKDLTLRLLRDDGAVVYLNGTQVYRSNMPTGTISYTTKASSDVSGSNEDKFFTSQVNPSLLINGVNVIAVEIHQRSSSSSDISFNFGLKGNYIEQPVCSPNTWIQKADVGGFAGVEKSGSVGFAIGNKGYIGLGSNHFEWGGTKDFWEYNPDNDTWTQKADYPGVNGYGVFGATGFSINNKGYVGTGWGFGTDYFTTIFFFEFDPITNTWTQKADVPGPPRIGAVGFSLNGKGYFGLGQGYLKDFYEYDPATDTWIQKADLGEIGLGNAVAFTIGNKGYVGTGNGIGMEADDYTRSFYEYNPLKDTWTKKADFGGLYRSDAVGFSIANKGYIGTGEFYGYFRDFWEYDPTLDTWIQVANYGGGERSSATGFSIGCKGYVGTGTGEFGSNYGKHFWQYCPASVPDIYTVITSPGDSVEFPNPTDIIIRADAIACDESIAKVEFYSDGNKIGEDNSFPYLFNWNNPPSGNHNLTVKAITNSGSFIFSDGIPITVGQGAGCIADGYILREYWNNVAGDNISDIPTINPEGNSRPEIFEGVPNHGDNYAERFRGYICAPQTGQYTFWIASDDDGELWLSTNENPANKVRIAYVSGYTTIRQWDKYPSQKSALINLTAGQRYYIEVLHKEETGGDNISVGWQLPDATFERPISGIRLSPYQPTEYNSPQVEITSPADGNTFTDPTSITINAITNLSKVEFFADNVKIGEDLSSPFSFIWNNPPAGNHVLVAKVRDNNDFLSTSREVNITIINNQACVADGNILREFWTNVPGDNISDFPTDAPDGSSYPTIFEGNTNSGDNYAERFRGYVCVTQSGQYRFWISSNNDGELRLSTDDNPENKVRIAFVDGYTNLRQWDKYASQKSALINLAAGQRYYIEAL